MGTMLDNCIVKNGFKTRMKVLLYLLLNISNMSMYKCMLIKTNESLRRDKYPAYGERLSSIEDTDLHGALKMSDRSAAISDAENNNDNTITVSTRCTTDEPIKLGGYVPASDSEEEEKDKKEIKTTIKVLGLHNEPNETGKEIDEDPGQEDEIKPHKECSKENKGKEAGNYSKYSNYKKEDKEKGKTKNETEEEYKDGEEFEKEDKDKKERKDEDKKEDKEKVKGKDEGEGNTKNETEEEYKDGEDLEKENEEKGKDKDEKEGRDKDEKVGEAKDKKESEGKDDKEGEYKDEEEIGEEDEEKGNNKDEKERRDKNGKEGKDRVKKEEKDKDKKAGNDDNDWEEDKGWEPYADKESDEGFKDWSEDEEFKEWENKNKGFPQIPLSLELTNTRVTKKYASPEPRDAPDHYIDDI